MIDDPNFHPLQCFLSNRLSLPAVIRELTAHLGPCALVLALFSLSQEFITSLRVLRDDGLVTRVEVTLDHKAAEKTARLLPYLRRTVESVYMARNHAKLVLLYPADGSVPVLVATSQNGTRNARAEHYVIISGRDVCDAARRAISAMPSFLLAGEGTDNLLPT